MNATFSNAASSASDASKKAWASAKTAAASPVVRDMAVVAGKATIITFAVLGSLKAAKALGL